MGKGKLGLVLSVALAFGLAFGLVAAPAVAQPAANAKVKFLIGFMEQPGPEHEKIVRDAGGDIKYTFHIVPVIAASGPESMANVLRQHSKVTHVDLDGRVWAIDAELDNTWGVKRIGAGTVHDGGNKGAGVKVAIIDTGIDYTHEDLDANYKGGYDFVNADTDPIDDHGHGTHVAGTVAAEDNDIGVVGVAPEADLYALKVLDATGGGYWSDVIAAIEWSVDPNADGDLSDRMDVINMSLGGTGTSDVEKACQAAWDAGLVLVAAAGNSGNPPGKGDNVIEPASYASVIAIAATNQDDVRARWSSTGPDLELAAPGVGINSTLLGGGYGEKDGTSMASPHVAGVAALVIAGEGLTNVEVRTRLQQTADDLGEVGFDTKYGYGLVDAAKAAGTAPDTTPPLDITTTSLPDGEVETAYSATLEAIGGTTPYTWSVSLGSLPNGLTLDSATGVISGTPTTEGIYEFTVQVVDSSDPVQSDTQALTMNITPKPTGLTDMWVKSIIMSLKVAGPWTSALATVTIVDGTGPVSEATVFGYWEINGTTSDTVSGATNGNGEVTFRSDKLRDASGLTFTFTVTDVTKDGWKYNPELSKETSGSIIVS